MATVKYSCLNNQNICVAFLKQIGDACIGLCCWHDMHTKMKQLGINMWQQVTNIVLRPLFDFIMDSFKVSKTHNMFVLMLNPQFKDLHLVGNYVGHFSTIKIATTYDS